MKEFISGLYGLGMETKNILFSEKSGKILIPTSKKVGKKV
jgi:hypothetical protein